MRLILCLRRALVPAGITLCMLGGCQDISLDLGGELSGTAGGSTLTGGRGGNGTETSGGAAGGSFPPSNGGGTAGWSTAGAGGQSAAGSGGWAAAGANWGGQPAIGGLAYGGRAGAAGRVGTAGLAQLCWDRNSVGGAHNTFVRVVQAAPELEIDLYGPNCKMPAASVGFNAWSSLLLGQLFGNTESAVLVRNAGDDPDAVVIGSFNVPSGDHTLIFATETSPPTTSASRLFEIVPSATVPIWVHAASSLETVEVIPNDDLTRAFSSTFRSSATSAMTSVRVNWSSGSLANTRLFKGIPEYVGGSYQLIILTGDASAPQDSPQALSLAVTDNIKGIGVRIFAEP